MLSIIAAGLLAAAPASAQLNTLAKAAGLLYFGTAVDNPSLNDAAYMAVANNVSEFGQWTPANGQKWDSVEPSQGQFNYANGDAITTKARANGQILRCHNTVWYNQLPSWVSSGSWTTTTLQGVLKTHITNEITHYKGQCYAWDVVNEALNDDGTYRTDVFYNILGTSYIPYAFSIANTADPAAKLYYNDYNIETAGAKSTAAQNIVKAVKAYSGARIDGVGFQAHFIVGSSPSTSSLVSNLKAFTALGVEVAYTELDVRQSSVPANAAAQAQQGVDYVSTVNACLQVPQCVGITVWDFDDKYSWIPSTFSGSGEGDLWSSALVKKPAYTSIANALKSAAGLRPTATGGSSAAPAPTTTAGSAPTGTTLTTVTVAPATTSTPAPVPTPTPTPSSPAAPVSGSCSSKYGQCGGIGWSGATCCASGSTCKSSNSYYSQCL